MNLESASLYVYTDGSFNSLPNGYTPYPNESYSCCKFCPIIPWFLGEGKQQPNATYSYNSLFLVRTGTQLMRVGFGCGRLGVGLVTLSLCARSLLGQCVDE